MKNNAWGKLNDTFDNNGVVTSLLEDIFRNAVKKIKS